jgi:hypothetical protein
LSTQLRIKAAVGRAWFNSSTPKVFLLSASISVGSRLTVPDHEELIILDEASAKHLEDFMARHLDIDLDEDPEATYGTDFRNMCGTHDKTGNNDPFLVLCVAITLSNRTNAEMDGATSVADRSQGPQQNIHGD